MVAIMLDLLNPAPGDRILEIGTGCGYHAAVTAEVVGPENVCTVEYYDNLASQARETFSDLGYDAISVRVGDGREGWAQHAPYDGAYLTCAGATFPPAVLEQTRPGGVVLGPLGEDRQQLIRGIVGADDLRERESHGAVRFVPLQ
jgi:protein-L-isoaspartate(D-aspartate) O-methyltransferase